MISIKMRTLKLYYYVALIINCLKRRRLGGLDRDYMGVLV